MPGTELLADPRLTSAFTTLGTSAVRATAVLLVGVIVTLVARRVSAATRHFIWTLTLGGALAVPVATPLMPEWRVPVDIPLITVVPPRPLPAVDAALAGASSIAVLAIAPTLPIAPSAATTPVQVADVDVSRHAGALPSTPAAVRGGGTASREASMLNEAAPARLRLTTPAVLVALWALGALVTMVPMLVGVSRLATVSRHARALDSAAWLTLVPTALREIGVVRRVRFIQLPGATMPMTWGILRPVVALPGGGFDATAAQRLDILRHELAHVRRHDCLTQILAQIACAVYWFNPIVWMVAREMRGERERACDDMVLRAGAKASDYADYLLRVARSTSVPVAASFGGMAMARPSQVGARLRSVLDDRRRRNAVSVGAAARASLIAVAGVAAIGSITPTPAVAREARFPNAYAAPAQRIEVRTAEPERTAGASLVREAQRVASAAGAATGQSATDVDHVARASWPPLTTSDMPPVSARVPLPAAALGVRETAGPLVSAAGPCDRASDQSGNSSHSNSITSNNGAKRWRVVWSSGDCSFEIDARGDITYNQDVTDIATISRGGSFTLEQHDGDDTRRLVVRPRDDGSLERSYSVNGARHDFDADARAWLAGALVALDRQTAFAADQRVPAILARGGVDAVLQEITLMGSDYARRRYYTRLLAARELTQAQVRRVVEQAGRDMSSDYELAELLVAVSKLNAFGDDSHVAFVSAASKIHSDYERRRALGALLSRDRLSPATVQALLEAASSIGSDYELAELLIAVSKRYAINDATRPMYLKAAGTIKSDYEHRRVLATIVAGGGLTSATTRALLEDASRIGSDYELAEFLVQMAKQGTLDAGSRDAYFAAADRIDSDYEHHRALSPLLKRDLLTKDLAKAVLASAAKIDSDYECASVLVEVANAIPIDDELRPAYERAADTIKGEYEYGRAMAAVRRRASER